MKVLIRKTISGSEYWDTKDKKTLFVPAREKPKFKITENPKTMIGGVDLATGSDKTVYTDKVVDNESGIANSSVETTGEKEGPNLVEMTIKELRAYAKENKIDIPKDVKRRDEIISLLSDVQ